MSFAVNLMVIISYKGTMSKGLNIQKVLKETELLLQDIEGELHFRLPDSKKIADIHNMVLWLKGGEAIPAYQCSTETCPQASAEDDSIDPFADIDSLDTPFDDTFGCLEKRDDDEKK
jgi:hypothetical protein